MHILLDCTDITFMINNIKKIEVCPSFLIIQGPWYVWCPSACLLKVEILERGDITNIQNTEAMIFWIV